MIPFQNAKAVELTRLEGRDLVAGDVSGIASRLRLSMELDGDVADHLPLSQAIRAAIQEGLEQSEAEGPNTSTHVIKRKWTPLVYQLSRGDRGLGEFEGRVVLSPRVKIVEGVASLQWTVAATLEPDVFRSLALSLKAENLSLKTAEPIDPQQDLPL